MTVVGLGDSVPAGTACSCSNYVMLVAQSLADREHAAATVTNLAANGATSAGLLRQLSASVTRSALTHATVAIVTIGANDFDAADIGSSSCARPQSADCYGDEVAAFGSRLRTILTEVRERVPPTARVLVTGYWNVFLDGKIGAARGASYVANSDALTRSVNAEVAAAAHATGATYVDVYTSFKGDGDVDDTALLAADGDHPDAAGHLVIASALLEALR